MTTDVAVVAKRRLAERKRKRRRIECICKFSVMAVICIVFFVILNYPFKETYDDGLGRMVLERKLTNNTLFIQKLPNQLPEMAWESDLPGFVERDLKWLDRQDRGYIIYMFGDFDIEISKKSNYDDGSEYYGVCIGNDIYGLTDFSLYEKGGKLYVYARDYICRNDFYEYVVSETEVEENLLTFDYKHIPIGVCDKKKDVSWRLADYAILLKENTFYFYQDGKMISENLFYDEIEDIYWSYSIVRTPNDILYGIYAYLDCDGIPRITSKYIDDSMNWEYDWGAADELIINSNKYNPITKLPIVEKDGEYYTYVPENWMDYTKYHIDNEDTVFLSELTETTLLSRKMVKLEDVFYSAEFYQGEYSGWYTNIYFEIDKSYESQIYQFKEYRIRGYDTSYEDYLTEQDIGALTTATFSLDGYWEIVEDIRETYEKYYEKKGG